MVSKRLWVGAYPAATTQFTETLEIDRSATRNRLRGYIADGVDGVVMLGRCSENNSLSLREKCALLDMATEVVDGRLPVVAGICENTASLAADFARKAQTLGADALMLLPSPAHKSDEEELFEYVRQVAAATSLPVMLCVNNSSQSEKNNLRLLEWLTSVPNLTAIKVGAIGTRRIADIVNAFGDRYVLMADLDGLALNRLVLGIKGLVSGLASAFPQEATAFMREFAAGKLEEARRIRRWFTPLLRLNAGCDFVQSIKLAERMMGSGSEHVRLPLLPLSGARRAKVTAILENAIATRSGMRLPDAA